jgi:ubiquinone/menaquinone biosynthesis C-methylase UbiE
MEAIRDPEGIEAKHLLHAGRFTGKQVLEIGCGYGWLTWQYSPHAQYVYGIDPGLPDLQKARVTQSAGAANVSLAQCKGEGLPFPADKFDTAVFSNSL